MFLRPLKSNTTHNKSVQDFQYTRISRSLLSGNGVQDTQDVSEFSYQILWPASDRNGSFPNAA